MFKHSSLIGLFFLATSCRQSSQQDVIEVTKSDTNVTSKVARHDTVISLSNTAKLKTKHEAYNADIKNLPLPLAEFITDGYTVLDTTSGDLNLDQYLDMVMVLKKNGEDTTSDVTEHPEKRPLLILLGQADNAYKLAARNENAVYCIDCGGMMGDPFMDIVIKKGYFSIEHYGGSGWRWTRTITFKYSSSENYWYLYKDGSDSFHATDPDKVTTKVRTTKDFGKVAFDKFDIYKED